MPSTTTAPPPAADTPAPAATRAVNVPIAQAERDALAGTALELARVLGGLPEPAGADAAERRDELLLLLETKIAPELAASSLPLFVGVQGGANVGKSTVFNALAGQLISPPAVLASSTRHPLLFVHEDWRESLSAPDVFGGVECRPLADPRELLADQERDDLLYVRYHGDSRLRGVGLIDSPDLDSLHAANARGAGRIAAIADVTVFVVTAQKYKDRGLFENLCQLLARQASVVLVFNFLDEEIVFDTLVEDLRSVLPDGLAPSLWLRVPTSNAKHPESEIEARLRDAVLPELEALQPAETKARVLARALEFAGNRAQEVLDGYDEELRVQALLADAAREGGVEAAKQYAAEFRLAFPEETLAVQHVLAPTELGTVLLRGTRAEKTSAAIGAVGRVLRTVRDGVRRILLRLTGRYEGSLDEEYAGQAEYAQSRREADADAVLRVGEALRVRVEGLARKRQRSSRLASRVLTKHFTPERVSEFGPRLRARYVAEVESTPGTGERLLAAVDDWLAKHRGRTLTFGVAGIAAKIATGLGLAALLPPQTGVITGLFSLLEWLWFACGYFLASYLIALVVSWVVPGRKAFVERRRQLVEQIISEELSEPLQNALADALDADECRRARQLREELLSAASG